MSHHEFIDVRHCARCGQDHDALEVRPFTIPMEDCEGRVWTHFGTCPATQEPILSRPIETPEEQPHD